MAEILGLGCTHFPSILYPDERLPNTFHRLLTAPNVPAWAKDRTNWPDELLAELGNDVGQAAARRYAARMHKGFRDVRASLDAFDPDIVLIYGDDQYENYREDCVPAFSVLAYAKGGIYAHEAAKVHVARDKRPDDFFFVTEPALFEALKGRGYNTVLQDNAHATDDGSLSVRCAKDGIRYVNVEAQHGHLDAQRDMLRALRDVIGPVPHDARLGSTPTH